MNCIYYLSLFGICFLIGISSARRIPSYRSRRHRRQAQGDWYQSDFYKQPSAGGDNSPVGIDWLSGGGSVSDTQGGSNNMPINIVENPGGQWGQWEGQPVPQPQPPPIYINQGQGGGGYPVPANVPNVESKPNSWLWEYQPSPSVTLSYEDRRALEKTLLDKKTKWEFEENQRREWEGQRGNPYAPGQIDYGPTHLRPHPHGQYQPGIGDPSFQPRPLDYYSGKILPDPNSQQMPYPPINIIDLDSNQQQPWDFQSPSGSNTFGGDGGRPIPPNGYEYVDDYSSCGRGIHFHQGKVLKFLFCVYVILIMI